jgi:hypothetical protein
MLHRNLKSVAILQQKAAETALSGADTGCVKTSGSLDLRPEIVGKTRSAPLPGTRR